MGYADIQTDSDRLMKDDRELLALIEQCEHPAILETDDRPPPASQQTGLVLVLSEGTLRHKLHMILLNSLYF